jgi:hypothetical protein
MVKRIKAFPKIRSEAVCPSHHCSTQPCRRAVRKGKEEKGSREIVSVC